MTYLELFEDGPTGPSAGDGNRPVALEFELHPIIQNKTNKINSEYIKYLKSSQAAKLV